VQAEHVEEVRQYLRDRQARREVVASTRTPLGQMIEWVPSAEKVADPPDEDTVGLGLPEGPADGREFRRVEAARFELETDSADVGPLGTVPVLHVDPEAITWTRTLQEFLAKDGRILRMRPDGEGDGLLSPEDETTHKYASSAQWVDCFGTEGNINAWDPYVQRDVEFSLGQTALARGRDASKQTVEAGHQEYRQKYGDWLPHLFVFYTTNGGSSGGATGGCVSTAAGSATTRPRCSAQAACASRPRRLPGTAKSWIHRGRARRALTWATATGRTRAGSSARS
jgi:hypothetical protein